MEKAVTLPPWGGLGLFKILALKLRELKKSDPQGNGTACQPVILQFLLVLHQPGLCPFLLTFGP